MLNARNHAEEAAIIAEAGQQGRVTIAASMAGRGVDILLGRGVAELGGLHVLGTRRSTRPAASTASSAAAPAARRRCYVLVPAQLYVLLVEELLAK